MLIRFAPMRFRLELPVVVVLLVGKETRERGHGCHALTGHDGRDASGHAQAGGRSMATERSESWPVRIAPSEGHEAAWKFEGWWKKDEKIERE